MPELPDLEVVRDVLNRRVASRQITELTELRPLVMRTLTPIDPQAFALGRTLTQVTRVGKFLLFDLGEERRLVWNFMLAGHLRFCDAHDRVQTRDYVQLGFSDDVWLRYHDDRGMGKLYLTHDLARVPGYAEMGPDALDPALTLSTFEQSLKRHRGEIKGVLTRGALVAGIGNAYADEILWEARIYPFRKSASLSGAEREALYGAIHQVLTASREAVCERMGDEIHLKIRDFLAVHNKKGEPCPRCGQTISEVNVAKRATAFCRQCQPGSLLQR